MRVKGRRTAGRRWSGAPSPDHQRHRLLRRPVYPALRLWPGVASLDCRTGRGRGYGHLEGVGGAYACAWHLH
eukprot:6815239-Alexandrium_andersonii.AAC.1